MISPPPSQPRTPNIFRPFLTENLTLLSTFHRDTPFTYLYKAFYIYRPFYWPAEIFLPKNSQTEYFKPKRKTQVVHSNQTRGLPSFSSLVYLFTLFRNALLNFYLYLSILQLARTSPLFIPPAFKRTPISLYTLLWRGVPRWGEMATSHESTATLIE